MLCFCFAKNLHSDCPKSKHTVRKIPPKSTVISERKRSQSFEEDAGGHSALSEPQTVNAEEREGGVTVAPEHPGATEPTAKV